MLHAARQHKNEPRLSDAEKVIDVTYGSNPAVKLISVEIVDKFDFSNCHRHLRRKLTRRQRILKCFTFVGNVDLATLKPLVRKYIGSIPTSKAINYVDDKVAPVTGESYHPEFTVPMQQRGFGRAIRNRCPYAQEREWPDTS